MKLTKNRNHTKQKTQEAEIPKKEKSLQAKIINKRNHKKQKSLKTGNTKTKIVSKRKYQRADVTKRCNHPNTCFNWNINTLNCGFINVLLSGNMQDNITQVHKLITDSLLHKLIKKNHNSHFSLRCRPVLKRISEMYFSTFHCIINVFI